MIPKINKNNVGPSIIILLILSIFIRDIIIPMVTTDQQLSLRLHFIFCVILSIVYIQWFFGKIGKGK